MVLSEQVKLPLFKVRRLNNLGFRLGSCTRSVKVATLAEKYLKARSRQLYSENMRHTEYSRKKQNLCCTWNKPGHRVADCQQQKEQDKSIHMQVIE